MTEGLRAALRKKMDDEREHSCFDDNWNFKPLKTWCIRMLSGKFICIDNWSEGIAKDVLRRLFEEDIK